MTRQHLAFIAALVVGFALFMGGAQLYRRQQSARLDFLAQSDFATFVRPHSQTLGAANAKVYLIEFTDPACETCAAFAPIVKRLLAAHPDRLKLVVRYAPLHPGSDTVVRLLHAAAQQGKFWEALDVMYRTQPAWASHHQPRPDLLGGFLAEAGLDMARLEQAFQAPATAADVAQDVADLQKLGVTKTPSFFVNGKPLVRFGERELEALVQSELDATR
ncbi:MAG: thioredoxin domain-containing protein [Deltaproteobacteria bacterium]|nr:thioredoxin domain-containing protein [Deltaproteobacteria bacterium]